MPPQPPALILPSLLRAVVPGAINLTADQLDGSFIVGISGAGIPSQQVTLAELQTYFSSAAILGFGIRVVQTPGTAVFGSTDMALLINLATPQPITVELPSSPLVTPSGGRVVIVKDMAGNAGTNAITLDAGAGHLINGQQTLIMNANYETTMLIGMSTTQWGTLI